MRDLRYAVRSLIRTPGFTAATVLSLALGIGANTAIFSILNALALRSLPVADPERLVVITRNNVSLPYPLFRYFQQHSRTLDGVLTFRTAPMRFSAAGQTERITGTLVSGSYFPVLGVRPILGSAIPRHTDEQADSGGPGESIVVLSHGFWMRRFGGQPSVVGAQILVNERPLTVVGVAPLGFTGTEVGQASDVFVPMTLQSIVLPGLTNALAQRRSNWVRIIGRGRRDRDVREAEAELTTLLGAYNQEILDSGEVTSETQRRSLANQRIALVPGRSGISGLRQQYLKPLSVLMAVMALVLLIACANIANLSLSRGAARRREIAIRLGLGASRGRLVSQLLTESLLLAGAGGLAGLIVARWVRDGLLTYLPDEQSLAASFDPGVLVVTATLATGTALVFGLAPAFQSTRVDLLPALNGSEMAARPFRLLFRQGLVVLQVALSSVVVIGAALFLRSLHNLLTVDTGFARENMLVAAVDGGARDPMQFYPRLLEDVKRLPGVVSAALADSPPLGTHTGWTIFIPGYAPGANEPRQSPSVGFISQGYFETMKLARIAGRDFDERDVATEAKVLIVNETFARHYFPGENPVGRMVGLRDGVSDHEIVGVVRDSKYRGLREGATRMVYVPYRPGPWASHMVVHLQTASDPLALASGLRQTVRALDDHAAVFNIRTVDEQLGRSVLRERLVATITGSFGGLALVLAATGVYGLLSYGVTRRTREFGIRMAVGARTGSILGMVLREATWLLATGIACGLIAAWAFGRIVTSLLFGIAPTDPVTIGIALALIAVPALIAAWIPARRASRLDPTLALRYQ